MSEHQAVPQILIDGLHQWRRRATKIDRTTEQRTLYMRQWREQNREQYNAYMRRYKRLVALRQIPH